ncbi:hypothetical protein KKD88_00610, partial [Patescibacteria group bacterium]|nr:hypothetical protein [Patescibacteria group bacterium]
SCGMLIFAHRGIHDRRTAENTLDAFEKAVELACDGIEFDLRLSRDAMPVVVHDETLDRIAGDARRVRDLSFKELAEVELRGKGRIPNLNEITSAIFEPVQFDIEIKDRGALQPLLTKLKTSASLRQRSIISSFVLEDLEITKKELPEVRTLLLKNTWPYMFRGRSFWKKSKAAEVWAVGFPQNILNRKRVAFIKRRGLNVAAYDLQPLKSHARRITKLGVDIAIVYKAHVCLR